MNETDSTDAGAKLPLIYTHILSKKSETTMAVKKLLAKVKDDHKYMPREILFRMHSDKGSEFLTAEMEKYLAFHAKSYYHSGL